MNIGYKYYYLDQLVTLTLGRSPYKGKNGEIRIGQLAFVNQVW